MDNVSDVSIYQVYFRYCGDPVVTCYRTTNYRRALDFIKMILSNAYFLESFENFGLTSEGLEEYVEEFIP